MVSIIKDVIMKPSILLKEEIVKASNNIRKKFNMIRHENDEMNQILDTTFKPITAPLNTLIKKEGLIDVKKEFIKQEVKHELNDKDTSADNIVEDNINESDDDENDYEDADDEVNLYQILSTYLKNIQPSSPHFATIDTNFGIRITNNETYMGNSVVRFAHNGDIKVKNENYKGSTGLYELIFLKKPEKYTKEDLLAYKKLLIETSAFRRDYNALGPILGNRGYKYKNVIAKLINVDSEHTGYGLLPKRKKVTSVKSEYIYWDDINELIVRLRLLISSRFAGHNGHDNEILSIIEELREANIIV